MLNKFICMILLTFCISDTEPYKLTSQQKKIINHAKSLEKSGLRKEAKNIYLELLIDFPHLKEALIPLSLILKNNNPSKLDELVLQYQNIHNNSLKSRIETFEMLLWTKNTNWEITFNEIKQNKSITKKDIELILNLLLKNNFLDKTLDMVEYLRDSKSPDYFSFQLGVFYSINMEFEKSVNEYLLYVKSNKSKKNVVRNRIMAFPEFETISTNIKNILINDDSEVAKLLLTDMYIKESNYEKAYDIIQKYSKNENDKIQFIKNLIRVKEFTIAQKVINNLLSTSNDKIILKNTILELAKIYENLFMTEIHSLPLTSNIVRNQFLNSQFIKLNEDNTIFLTKAINIYDSLRIHTKDSFSTYQLAEIKYRILGDLDGAAKLYNELINKKDRKFYDNSLNRIIDIQISKSNLTSALELIDDKIESNKDVNTQNLLETKKIQVLFYLNKMDDLKTLSELILKKKEKNDLLYNDILKINSDLLLFRDNKKELGKYSLAMFKIYQNKRIEAIEILNSIEVFESYVYDKIIYESAYLNFLQKNFEIALMSLEQIDKDSAYIESSLLLKAEINDYILINKSKAAEIYLYLLDSFPNSIHNDKIRQRLRSLAS